MKKRLFGFLLLLIFGSSISAQNDVDKRVQEIRKVYSEIAQNIEAIEKDDESGRTGPLAVNELIINKLNRSWAAVGNYRVVYRFYYQNKGEEPYPTHLVKVTQTTESAARRYYKEFVYGKTGRLIFYFEKSSESETPEETRIYFSTKKAIRIIEGEKVTDTLSARQKSRVHRALKDSARVKRIFVDSIEG